MDDHGAVRTRSFFCEFFENVKYIKPNHVYLCIKYKVLCKSQELGRSVVKTTVERCVHSVFG